MDYSIFINFLLAIGVGAMIGIEREMPTGSKKSDANLYTDF